MDQALWQSDLDDRTQSGSFERFDWTLSVRPMQPQLGSGEEVERETESEDYELKRVSVTVAWESLGGNRKSIVLESARIMEAF